MIVKFSRPSFEDLMNISIYLFITEHDETSVTSFVTGYWRIMFEHRISDDSFEPFVDESDAVSRNTANGSVSLYSVLEDMESMRFKEGQSISSTSIRI